MKRIGIGVALLAAIGATACGGDGAGGGTTPTSPSGSASTGSGAQASCTMPSAPTNLQVTSVAGTTVSLSWTGVSNATQYVVLVGKTSGNSEELSTNTSQTNYTYGGVQPGVHYARVQSKNSCGQSGSSNQVDFTIAG